MLPTGKKNYIGTRRVGCCGLKEVIEVLSIFMPKQSRDGARNRITRLRNSMNQWVESEEGIAGVAAGYFQHLFTSSNPATIEDTIRYITLAVSADMNQRLIQIPHDEEIWRRHLRLTPRRLLVLTA